MRMQTTALPLDAMIAAGREGRSVTREQALAILRSEDDQIVPLVAAAGQVRRQHFANRIKLNYLVNLKSGLCPEDCSYCSQALGADTVVLKYSWL